MLKRHGKAFSIVTLVLAGLLMGSCAGVRPQRPEVSLKRLQVGEISLSHANLLAELTIYNPNLIDLTLEQVEYTLLLNDVRIAAGRNLSPVTIASHGHGEVTLNLSAAYLDLYRMLQSREPGEVFTYALLGNIRVGGLGLITANFPLKETGQIRLEK